MRSFQKELPEFDKRGIRVVAISVDPPEVNQAHRKKMGFTFPLLSDVGAVVIRQYDQLHAHAGPHQEDISRPAEFLLNREGVVQWRNLTEVLNVRAWPQQVLKAYDATNSEKASAGP